MNENYCNKACKALHGEVAVSTKANKQAASIGGIGRLKQLVFQNMDLIKAYKVGREFVLLNSTGSIIIVCNVDIKSESNIMVSITNVVNLVA